MDDKFVLFAWDRTGGSTLSFLLQLHPDIKCFYEPFHPRRGISLPPDDIRTLDDSLNSIWKTYDGIKHNAEHIKSYKQNKHMLLNPDHKVIFLWRKNFLRREVSSEISIQSNAWGIYSDVNDKGKEKLENFKYLPLDQSWIDEQANRLKNEVKNFKFLPLDVPNINEKINKIKNEVKKYRRLLMGNEKEFFEITYEELYGADLTEQQKIDKLNEIFQFLGRGEIKDKETQAKLKCLLDPKKLKLNSGATYRLIPNIDKIEKKLGCRENGYLFKKHDVNEEKCLGNAKIDVD